MLQELLNRDDAYLWAILSNGGTLRLLRDSTALVGSSYVEFDLEAIFDGELFSDFVLLYLTCHESRFAIQGDGSPVSCYLEQWRGFAAQQGERALDQLRTGVQQAIAILGTGFLSHPANPHLRGRLHPGSADLKLDDFNRALLRLVYRMLFWFVAEDRGALLQPDPDDADTAINAMRPMLGFYIGGMGAKDMNFHKDVFARMGYEKEVDEVQDLFLEGKREAAVAAVPDSLVTDISLIGSLAKIRDDLAEWEDAGVTMLVVGARSLDELRTTAEAVLG